MRDKYLAYWSTVAKRLSSNNYVVGFDPFNEPGPAWHGFAQAIYELTMGHFDSSELAPLYSDVFKKYMEVDQQSIMWFEPAGFPDVLPFGKSGVVLKSGFKTPPGGQIGSTHHVLNEHTYCCNLG